MAELELFFGQASPAEARVYARLRGEGLDQRTLSGSLTGPYSKLAKTLPAKLPFRALEPGATLLAEAVVPDPCFWTPESPFLYRAELAVQDGKGVILREQRSFGIRPLGTRGQSLYFEGRRWVLRGGSAAEQAVADLSTWREEQVALIRTSLSETLLAGASEQGVPLVGMLTGASAETLPQLKQLACWPAVCLVIVDSTSEEAEVMAQRPRNLLLGQRLRIDPTVPLFQPAAWADVIVGDVADPALFVEQTRHLELPIIARRVAGELANPTSIRAACDQLQRDLAPYGDFAGYLV